VASPRLATPTPTFINAAEAYAEQGIAVVPLGRDKNGRPKIPQVKFYPRLRPEDNLENDWSFAAGLGIVLGRPSGHLAAIDVDDPGLADFLKRRLSEREAAPLMDETPRPGLHIWCVEPVTSTPVDLEVRYQNRPCLVQILGAACQAAAPPTPGYFWLTKGEPFYGTAGSVWNRIAKEFGLAYRAATPFSFLRHERSRGPATAEIREALEW
jgi:Bifunctional DNA primase/polymerase, N-terminal